MTKMLKRPVEGGGKFSYFVEALSEVAEAVRL